MLSSLTTVHLHSHSFFFPTVMEHAACMYLGVPWRNVLVWSTVFIIWMGTVCADHVHISRNDHTEDLFSCPQGLGFEYGWLYKLAIPIRNPHHQIHHSILMKE